MNNTLAKHLVSLLPYIFTVMILVLLPAFSGSYTVSILIQVLIFAIFASSLGLLMGYTGLPSFGHAAFFGTGAYTTGILITQKILNPGLAGFAGILMAMVIAAIFGLLVLRTSGVYFLMITLALGELVHSVVWHFRSLTGGDDGLPGILRPDFGIPLSIETSTHFYYFILIVTMICFFLLRLIVNSPFGQVLVGIRENEPRIRSLGYNSWAYKYICYIVSGIFAAVAGVLYAYFNRFVSPSEVGLALSGEVMLMVIMGGRESLFGAAIGAGVMVLLKHFVSIYTEHWQLILGMVFVLTIFYARRGIMGYIEDLWLKVRR